MIQCGGCHKATEDYPYAHEGNWWCWRCLQIKVSKAIIKALLYTDA